MTMSTIISICCALVLLIVGVLVYKKRGGVVLDYFHGLAKETQKPRLKRKISIQCIDQRGEYTEEADEENGSVLVIEDETHTCPTKECPGICRRIENKLFPGDCRVFKCSECKISFGLTPEQESIKFGLIKSEGEALSYVN